MMVEFCDVKHVFLFSLKSMKCLFIGRLSEEDARTELQEMVNLLKQDFFEPEKNNLKAKSD